MESSGSVLRAKLGNTGRLAASVYAGAEGESARAKYLEPALEAFFLQPGSGLLQSIIIHRQGP